MDATPKRGRPRDPAKLALILAELSGDPAMFFEYGAPPYNVADVARRLEMDPSNLRAYLLALERDGLVIREHRKVDTWNAIAAGHLPRRVLCFWSVATPTSWESSMGREGPAWANLRATLNPPAVTRSNAGLALVRVTLATRGA